MILSASEKSGIKQILTSQYWKSVESLAEEIIKRIREERVIGDNEWETVKAVVDQEGQIKGIKRLFQELYLQINEQKS